ncbi:hypothetical protein I4U23_016978 [Adineta vaga]|nr:hypothetical protein I4U23_016978 [Adineta vaga]
MIRLLSGLSFNQPKFCASASWNSSGTNLLRLDVIFPYSIFITTNNSIFIGVDELSSIYVSFNYLIKVTKINSFIPTITTSIFVQNDNEIYVQTLIPEPTIIRWILNTNNQTPVMDIPYLCYALFIDIDNNLYCSLDTRHEIIKKWLGDNSTMAITIAGTGVSGMSSDTLNGPRGIFVDLNSNLYVADYTRHEIVKKWLGDDNSVPDTTAGTGFPSTTPESLNSPRGIFVDLNSNFEIKGIQYNIYGYIRSIT